MSSASIACVVVAFESNDVLGECLESIPTDCTVIVVDQPARNDPRQVVATCRPSAHVVRPVANRGFGAGCNLGSSFVDEADVIVFLNPDVRLGDRALEVLASEVLAHQGTLVGPRILGADGVDKTCARRRSTIGRDLADLWAPKKYRPAHLTKHIDPSDMVYTVGGEVDFVQGACMAIATGVFRSTGGFNEAMFLYGEEEWLALALGERNLKPRLAPAAVVYHAGQHSTDKVATFAVEQLYRSRAIIYRALYAKPVALLGVALNVVALVALILTHPVRRPLRFRPVEDPAWCRSALRGLARGLFGRTVDPPTVR